MNKWEEKNYTEQEKNCLNNSEQEEIAITKSMRKESKSKECKNTGWTRKCPMCNRIITYTQQANLCRANRKNHKCKECGKKFSGAKKGRTDTPETKERKRKSAIGRKYSKEFGEAVRKRMIGNKNSAGKPKPKHWKEKLIVKMARNYQEPNNIGKAFLPNYNEKACEYFDWLNKFMGWNG